MAKKKTGKGARKGSGKAKRPTKREGAKAKKPARKAVRPAPKPAAPKPVARAPLRRRIRVLAPHRTRHRPLAANIYERDLDKTPANFAMLTPLQFLERSASVYPDKVALVHGGAAAELERDLHALPQARLGAGQGRRRRRATRVTIMAPNIPEMYEAHFGVPMSGAVLNCLNTRLDAAMLAFILDHSETKVLLVDREYHRVVKEALAQAKARPLVVDIDDPQCDDRAPIGDMTWEEFIAQGDADYAWEYRRTNGTPSRSTTPRAQPAIRKEWCFTIEAPRCRPTGTPRNGR